MIPYSGSRRTSNVRASPHLSYEEIVTIWGKDGKRKAEPTISRIYLFPSDNQIRLVELDTTMTASDDVGVVPFYFKMANDLEGGLFKAGPQ